MEPSLSCPYVECTGRWDWRFVEQRHPAHYGVREGLRIWPGSLSHSRRSSWNGFTRFLSGKHRVTITINHTI